MGPIFKIAIALLPLLALAIATTRKVTAREVTTREVTTRDPTNREVKKAYHAFDCSEGSVTIHKHIRELREITGETDRQLRENQIYFQLGKDEENEVLVIVGDHIMKARCKTVRVEHINSTEGECYMNQALKVRLPNGTISYADENHFIIENPARIPCPHKGASLKDRTLQKIRNRLHFPHTLAALQSAVSGHAHTDYSNIFNEDTALKLVQITEKCLCYKIKWLVNFKIFYRRYFAGILLLYSLSYTGYTGILFTVAKCLGISSKRACKLIFPPFKRFIELLDFHQAEKECKKSKIMKAMRANLGLKPEEKLENVFARHMETSYSVIHSLVRRVNSLERRAKNRKPVKRVRKGLRRSPKGSREGSRSISADSRSTNEQTDVVHCDMGSETVTVQIGHRDSPDPCERKQRAPKRQRIVRQ